MSRSRPISPLVKAIAMAALLIAVAACSDDGGGGDASSETVDAPEWVEHEGGPECECADGSDFSFFSRTADTDKVVLFFQGGGACFNAESCAFDGGTYLSSLDDGQVAGPGAGIFDFANDDNPFRDWSVVYVPYCTGDVHIGDSTQEYSPELTVAHRGFVNATSGIDHLVENFGDASEVFVTGSSAGGIPAPLAAGLVADELPDAEVASLSDASGAYPDNPPVNVAIGSLWEAFDNAPDWPENEGLAPEEWSIPGLTVQSARHNADLRFARYDNAYDETQQAFVALSGVAEGDLQDIIKSTEAGIEAEGVDVHSYLAPGTNHTILGQNLLYDLEVEGESFLDWLTRYVEGEDVPDVACTDCGSPAGPES